MVADATFFISLLTGGLRSPGLLRSAAIRYAVVPPKLPKKENEHCQINTSCSTPDRVDWCREWRRTAPLLVLRWAAVCSGFAGSC
jgi:hypothetical protein